MFAVATQRAASARDPRLVQCQAGAAAPSAPVAPDDVAHAQSGSSQRREDSPARSESPTPLAADLAAPAAALTIERASSRADVTANIASGQPHTTERMKTEAEAEGAAAVAYPAPLQETQQMPIQAKKVDMVSWPDASDRQQAATRPQTCKGGGPAVPPPWHTAKAEAASDQLLQDTADADEESDGGCSGSDNGGRSDGGGGSPSSDALDPADSIATAPVLGTTEAPQASGLSASANDELAEGAGDETATAIKDTDAGEPAAAAAAADLAATARAAAAAGDDSDDGALSLPAGSRAGRAAGPAAGNTAAMADCSANGMATRAAAAGGGAGGVSASQQWWPAAVANTGRMRIPAATTRALLPQRSRSGAGPPNELTFVVGRDSTAPEACIPIYFAHRTTDNSWTVDALTNSWRSLSRALARQLPATAGGAPADQLPIGSQLLLSRGQTEGTVHIRLAGGAHSAERAVAAARPPAVDTTMPAPAGATGSGQAAAAAAATASRRNAVVDPTAAVDRTGTLMIGAAVMRALMPLQSAAGGQRPDQLTFLVASAQQGPRRVVAQLQVSMQGSWNARVRHTSWAPPSCRRAAGQRCARGRQRARCTSGWTAPRRLQPRPRHYRRQPQRQRRRRRCRPECRSSRHVIRVKANCPEYFLLCWKRAGPA